MSRWAGLAADPHSGGSTLDSIKAGLPGTKLPVPTVFVPVTTGDMDDGLSPYNRNDEVRGRRANVSPVSGLSAPVGTIGGRAYPKILNKLIRYALGGAVTKEGAEPAAITSKVGALESGSLPPLIYWLLREEQLDRMAGAIVASLTMSFPTEGDGTYTASLEGLYKDVQQQASPKEVDGITAATAYPTVETPGFVETYKLRDMVAKRGAGEEQIANLVEFDLTYDNGMITDVQSKFAAGHNIRSATVDGKKEKLWLPSRHEIGAQNVSGKIALSSVDAASEARRQFQVAEKLIVEVPAGPIATEPESTEMLRLVLSEIVLGGEGAGPIVREGAQRASFDFTAHLDPETNTDVEAQFVAAAEVK